jgi:hypothetical protein
LGIHRDPLAAAIYLLREIVFAFKGCAEYRVEYVRNIEVRLGYIEKLFELTFAEKLECIAEGGLTDEQLEERAN